MAVLVGFGWFIALLPVACFASDTGQGDSGSDSLEDVVVTAQKRSQSIGDVGMSITPSTTGELRDRGVSDVADLEKAVPGFSYAEAPNGRPIFTLRGVGFYDTSLSASPTTSVYVDEIALPFSVMTRAADLDIERVEVLKGPQGTLFGENSTGGAVNFIASKPTSTFMAGFDATAARFDKGDVNAFISGPLTETLNFRFAIRSVQGGDHKDVWLSQDLAFNIVAFFGPVRKTSSTTKAGAGF